MNEHFGRVCNCQPCRVCAPLGAHGMAGIEKAMTVFTARRAALSTYDVTS